MYIHIHTYPKSKLERITYISAKMYVNLKLFYYLISPFFISPVIPHQQYESLQNFDLYLSTFKSCLIHLINYRGVNFEPFLHPVVTSRYDVVVIQREGDEYPTPVFFRHEDSTSFRSAQIAIAKVNVSFVSDELFSSYEEMLKVRWKLKCSVQFYILPPEVDGTFEGRQMHDRDKMAVPFAWSQFWRPYQSLDFFTARYVHILNPYILKI